MMSGYWHESGLARRPCLRLRRPRRLAYRHLDVVGDRGEIRRDNGERLLLIEFTARKDVEIGLAAMVAEMRRDVAGLDQLYQGIDTHFLFIEA